MTTDTGEEQVMTAKEPTMWQIVLPISGAFLCLASAVLLNLLAVLAWCVTTVPVTGAPVTEAHMRFTVTADTVIDSKAGLMWQRVVPDKKFTWTDAKEYAARLKLGGYSDWRLPTKEELKSIVDFSHHDPSIDPIAFPNTPAEFFWSLSPVASKKNYVSGVYFDGGFTFNSNTILNNRVRCVR